jgi:hypothetical protein
LQAVGDAEHAYSVAPASTISQQVGVDPEHALRGKPPPPQRTTSGED